MRNRRRNFTLVELLVVIGIIAILAGMLMAGIMYAPAKAQKAKAQAEITTLMNAIKQFEATYGVLPLPDGVNTDKQLSDGEYKTMIAILQADEDSTAWANLSAADKKKNKRRTKFLDIQGNDAGSYIDPWGENYYVVIDGDYDGKIKLANIIPGVLVEQKDSKYVYRYSVVVWGTGKDRKSVSGANVGNSDSDKQVNHPRNEDNVYSFTTTWSSSTGHTISK